VITQLFGPGRCLPAEHGGRAGDHRENLIQRSRDSRWPVTSHGAPVSASCNNKIRESVS